MLVCSAATARARRLLGHGVVKQPRYRAIKMQVASGILLLKLSRKGEGEAMLGVRRVQVRW